MPTSTSTVTQRQGKDVLLVEPPSVARERHEKTLARNRYRVFAADDIDQARAQWEPDRFGLVIVSLDGFAELAGDLCDFIKDSDSGQLIALIFNPDQELPATDCATLIFTTEPDEYFLARVVTLTSSAYAA